MARQPRWKGFYFITDAGLSVNGVIEDVRQAISAGIAMLQYREKDNRGRLPILSKKIGKRPLLSLLSEAEAIKQLCRSAGVPFLINDDVEMALKVEADGVHVGQKDMAPEEARRILGPKAIIGVSVATVEETRKAVAAGASYVAVSPVFATGTKPDAGPGLGIEGIRAIRACTDLPLAAIGGITRENVNDVMKAGADLICAISASLLNGRVRENIAELRIKYKV